MNVLVVDRSNVGAIAGGVVGSLLAIVILLILIVVIVVIILKCRSNDVSNQGIAIIGFFNIIIMLRPCMDAVYYTLVTVYCADVCDEDTKETHFKMENNIVYGRPGIQLNSAWVWALKISLH